jgi:hypothetical protein
MPWRSSETLQREVEAILTEPEAQAITVLVKRYPRNPRYEHDT